VITDNLRISTASKILHRKRPNLIPVMDNQAILGGPYNGITGEKSGYASKACAVMKVIRGDLLTNETEALLKSTASECLPEEGYPLKDFSTIRVFDMVLWEDFQNKKGVSR
jgi:hypothetical protein